MKKILFRKLLSDCLVFFFITLFSASIIIWVFQAVNFLDIMIEDGRDYLVYLNYSALNFPKIITRVLPFIFFFSFFYVITKYELNNELLILWNFGINKLQIINFFFKFSIILVVFQICLGSFIVPKTQDLARSFLLTSEINFFESFIKPRKFNDTIKGLTIYSDSKDQNGNLNNIFLKKQTESNVFQITYAKKGLFKKIGNSTYLELSNGETISVNNKNITNFKFSKSDFNLQNLKTNKNLVIKTQQIPTLNHIKCYLLLNDLKIIDTTGVNIGDQNCIKNNQNNIIKELYKRIVIPFYIPVLMFIVLLLIIKSKENVNYFNYRIFVFILGLITIISSEMSLRFVNENLENNIEIIFIPLLMVIIFYFFFLIQFNHKIKAK